MYAIRSYYDHRVALGDHAVVVHCAPDLAIGEAARLMASKDVSVLPVLDQGRLVGILTDKDLRRRVLAVDLDPAVPVAQSYNFV